MENDEALSVLRVLVMNGCTPDGDTPIATIIAWLGRAGFDEEACLRGLGEAAIMGWIVGIGEFEAIRLTTAGAATIARSTH